VLGGDEAAVLARLEQLDLVAANRNAAGQIVAAGRLSALDKLAEDPPEKARVVRPPGRATPNLSAITTAYSM
jgi:[acyl-carrier-protein] S-malonyltransferase